MLENLCDVQERYRKNLKRFREELGKSNHPKDKEYKNF